MQMHALLSPKYRPIAIKRNWQVIFVASYDHIPNKEGEYGEWVFVDPGNDAADLYILNHIKRHDVLITQDIGLASLVLAKGVYALSHKGKEYKEDSIRTALDYRYLAAKERAKGNYGKGPKTIHKCRPAKLHYLIV